MYYLKIEEEKKHLYSTMMIDGKTFYYFKASKNSGLKKQRRYSDQFRTNHLNYKDIYRKLKILEKHKNDNSNLDDLTEKWKDCISRCIFSLKNEFEFPVTELFKIFKLKKYGFMLADFGADDMISEESEE